MGAALTLWIDADACPRDIQEIVLRAAERVGVEAVLVANKRLEVRSRSARAVRVEKGADVADAYIVRSSVPGDLVVTADIPLAALLVDKGVVAIDPRGALYSDGNIGERLSVRDFMHGLRETGVVTGGPRKLDPRDKKRFAATLDAELTRALRARRGE